VCSIIATVSSTLNSDSLELVSRSNELRASLRRFLRTYHHGDLRSQLQHVIGRWIDLLWGKDEARQYQDRPKPLYTERNAVCALIEIVDRTSTHSRSKELADNPAHVDERRQVWSKDDWCDLRSILGRYTLERTPWDS
jgi:hypothetical protein